MNKPREAVGPTRSRIGGPAAETSGDGHGNLARLLSRLPERLAHLAAETVREFVLPGGRVGPLLDFLAELFATGFEGAALPAASSGSGGSSAP